MNDRLKDDLVKVAFGIAIGVGLATVFGRHEIATTNVPGTAWAINNTTGEVRFCRPDTGCAAAGKEWRALNDQKQRTATTIREASDEDSNDAAPILP